MVSEIELFEHTTAKLLIRKRYYVYILFLIPVFIFSSDRVGTGV